MAYSAGPTGFYVAELFQRMGIADAADAIRRSGMERG